MALKWREDLSVGNDVIDSDHKHFIQIINEVEGSLIIKNKVELDKSFDNLSQYSLAHFSREERIANKIGFPNVQRLHDSHTALSDKLLQLKQEIDEDWSPAWVENFTTVLRDWLLNHIIKEDLLMKPFFAKRVAEISRPGIVCRQNFNRSNQESSSSQRMGDSQWKDEATTDYPAQEPALGEKERECGPTQAVEDKYKYNSPNVTTSRAEVLSILGGMSKQGSLLTCRFNHGKDFLLTQILDIFPDGNTLILDQGNDISMNRNILLTDRINCESRLDKVKIQFILHGVAPFKYEGREVFLGSVPASLRSGSVY